MSGEYDIAIVLGLAMNLLATVGGVMGFMLRYERRISAIETHLLHLLPRRKENANT